MRKYFTTLLSRTEQKYAIILVIAFLVSRLWNLTILPIFTDEAIYIRWSEIAWSVRNLDGAKTLVFIPLTDGKQPLFMWIGGFFMQFISNHLWAGRLPSVVSGLLALCGIWVLVYELFKNKRIAWIASIIYFILPFTYLYDRMALADSMLAMSGIWVMYASLIFVKKPTLKKALILGLAYGIALLVKSPAIFFWVLTPVTLLFATFLSKRAEGESPVLQLSDYFFWRWSKNTWQTLGQWTLYYGLAVIIGQAIQSVQRVSGLYQRIAEKNLEFLITNRQFLEHPFQLTYGNMYGMSVWFLGYLSIPLVLSAIIAILYGLYRRDKRVLYLLILFIVPWVTSATMAKVLYPRYLLYFTPPLLILISYGVHLIMRAVEKIIPAPTTIQNVVKAFVYAALFGYSLYFTTLLLFNPTKAPLPLQDEEQYVTGWPSGYGVPEVTAFLKEEYKKNGKIAVGTEGTFGLMPFALEINFHDEIYSKKNSSKNDPNDRPVYIEGYYPFLNVPQTMIEFAARRPTYFLVYQREDELLNQCPVEQVLNYVKPGAKTRMRLYKVIAQERYAEIRCVKY
jgi:4-amino-4-deoxy-L-arabinose transferase-like glycosyltransferase